MSILIKGEKMPEKCEECWFFDTTRDENFCKRTGAAYNMEEYCPFVEVKTPHGRLMDLDAALNKLIHKLGIKSLDYLTPSERAIVDIFTNELTVIEAEE